MSNFFNLNERESIFSLSTIFFLNFCYLLNYYFFKFLLIKNTLILIGPSPGVTAFCTSDEICWSLISRSCLDCPPVSLCSSAFIAGNLFCRKSHIVIVSYNDSNLFLSLSFELILFLDVFIGYLFNISAITFQLIVFWYQYLTAIRTESHYFCSRIMFLL